MQLWYTNICVFDLWFTAPLKRSRECTLFIIICSFIVHLEHWSNVNVGIRLDSFFVYGIFFAKNPDKNIHISSLYGIHNVPHIESEFWSWFGLIMSTFSSVHSYHQWTEKENNNQWWKIYRTKWNWKRWKQTRTTKEIFDELVYMHVAKTNRLFKKKTIPTEMNMSVSERHSLVDVKKPSYI